MSTKTEVTFTAVGAPAIDRGMILVLQDGTRYVVKRQTGSTITLVPMRWWHRIPWRAVLFGLAGLVVGQLLSRFIVEAFK